MSIDETWDKLSANIREIFKHNAANLSFEENHRYGYNMVLHKHGKRLYDGVVQLIIENIDYLASTEVVPVFPTSNDNDPIQQSQRGEMLLKAFRRIWNDHIDSMSKLRDILKYMVTVILDSPHDYMKYLYCRIEYTPKKPTFLKYTRLGCTSSTNKPFVPQ